MIISTSGGKSLIAVLSKGFRSSAINMESITQVIEIKTHRLKHTAAISRHSAPARAFME